MSSEPQPQVRGQRQPEKQGYGKLIAWGVIAVLILIFVLSNRVKWQFSFLFLHVTWPAYLVLIITLVIGFAVGWVTMVLLRRRKKRELRRRAAAS